jgi:heat shock protein HslJ
MRVFAAALLGLIAASPASAEQAFDYGQLGNTNWTAAEWNGAAPKPKLVPQITFAAKNRFTASAGCNRHMGVYKVAGEGIAFEAQSSTKMACPGERGEADQRMVADLKRIARLSLTPDGKFLVAHAANGAAILKMRCTKSC